MTTKFNRWTHAANHMRAIPQFNVTNPIKSQTCSIALQVKGKLNPKYTKEILKNTREKVSWANFCLFALKPSF